MHDANSAEPAKRNEVRVQWGIRVPLRDGVHLSAILYLPETHSHPTPAIVTLTPYVAQTFHDFAVHFAAHGYPFIAVDVRGRGNSEGTFRPLINEAPDAFDVVEWLARQPFCNGQVAMWGGSYGGHVQWAAARELPPHLATIVPAAPPYIGVDFPIRNNIAAPYWMQWLTLVWGRTLQDKIFWNNELYWGAAFARWFESGAAFAALDAQLGNPSSIFQEWLSHPEQGEYWDEYNPTAQQYARIELPILTITGIYDGDQLGALAHYREHLRNTTPAGRAAHYLVIGPWDHAGTRTPVAEFCGLRLGPASLLDLRKLHREWYAWTMQGGSKPDFLRRSVAYYVTGAEHWRYADSLEQITARTVSLYLHSVSGANDVMHSGSLAETPPQAQSPDQYVYDPRDVSLAQLESTVDPENRVDQRMHYACGGRQLVYHSAPFDAAVEISGFFRASVWLAIDQPDSDFRVQIYEVAVDGSAVQLTTDTLRARYRENPRRAKLIETRQPLRYDFDHFPFVSRRIASGCRLRLVVGPLSSIYSEKNYNSGGVVARESVKDARTVTVRLFHDATHLSVLHVPYGQLET